MSEVKRYDKNGEPSEDGYFIRYDEYLNEIYARDYVINELGWRIKELESDKHINEIKSQGIKEAIYYTRSKLSEVDNLGDIDQADEHFLLEYIETLRGNQ